MPSDFDARAHLLSLLVDLGSMSDINIINAQGLIDNAIEAAEQRGYERGRREERAAVVRDLLCESDGARTKDESDLLRQWARRIEKRGEHAGEANDA